MKKIKELCSVFPLQKNNFTLYMKILQEHRGSICKITPQLIFIVLSCTKIADYSSFNSAY